jgi:hypothetical protein
LNIFKYIKQSADVLMNRETVFEMNGMVLTKTSDALFNLHTLMANEVKDFCRQQGHPVDKVVFVTCYDAPIAHDFANVTNLKLNSDSRISIVQDKEGLVARVLMASHLEVEEDARK